MHKESKEALLNAEKKCRECLSILKNTSWSIEDNCSEETIDAMESAYQKSVDVLLSIEDCLLKVPDEKEQIQALQKARVFDNDSFLVPDICVEYDKTLGLSCTISSPPLLKKAVSRTKYGSLLMDGILFQIHDKLPVVDKKIEQAAVIFVSYVSPSHNGKSLYYDNDNIAIKRLLDIIIPRICIDDAACYCDNFYLTQPAQATYSALYVVEKSHLKEWIRQHKELQLFRDLWSE